MATRKTDLEKMAAEIKRRLAQRGVSRTTTAEPPKGMSRDQWRKLVDGVTAEVVAEVREEFRLRRMGVEPPDFTPLSPDEVAEPVDMPIWRVRGLLALGSHGAIAGPKKSLKTFLWDCISIGVASGKPVLGTFQVEEPGPVLTYAGEGNIEWRRKSLQRIARDLYGLTIGEDTAPIHLVPVAYPFNTPAFRSGLRQNMEEIKPAIVTLDSTYNYHPRGVNTADMYDRGPLFAELSALVHSIDREASLLLIDHMRQAASLDLDAIAMAGMGPWVDSWLLTVHREPANPEEGLFRLAVEIGSRRWGGRRRNVDVDLGHYDENADTWSHPITVNVTAGEWGDGKRSSRSANNIDLAILQIVKDSEWQLTESQLVKEVGGNAQAVRDRIAAMKGQRQIVVEKRDRLEGSANPVQKRRDLVGFPDSAALPRTTASERRSPGRSCEPQSTASEQTDGVESE